MKKLLIFTPLFLLIAVSCNPKHSSVISAPPISKPVTISQIVEKAPVAPKKNSSDVAPTKIAVNSVATTTTPTTTEPTEQVTMKIVVPDGETSFELNLKPGSNACKILTQAYEEKKVKSLTIDNSYMESLNSAYVYEINGYKNNWIMAVNGKTPSVGCSQVFPNNGDLITWKFN